MNPNEPRDFIADDGSYGKYFHMMLNLADDELDPWQYRLLGHYRRVCGLRGACWESIETTATTCKMSVGKASKVRRWLAANGWITLTTRKNNGVTVRIVDRMADNTAKYQPSPDEGMPSCGEGMPSRGEAKKQLYKKQQNTSAPSGARAPSEALSESKPKAKAPKKDAPSKPAQPRPRDEMFDAVARHIFGIDPAAVGGSGGRIGKIANWLKKTYKGKDLAEVGEISAPAQPDHVRKFAEHCVKKNLTPPRDLIKFVESWRAWAHPSRANVLAFVPPTAPEEPTPLVPPEVLARRAAELREVMRGRG